MLSKKIGVDLGTSALRIYVKGEGVVVDEPSVVAIAREGARIVAVGHKAREMAERASRAIELVRPVRGGGLGDYAVTEGILRHFIGKAQGRQRIFKPEVMIAVPSGATSADRRAVTEAAISAGGRQAWLIDAPLAAAIGARLPISGPGASAICDIGAATTEMAVMSLSGMVVARSIAVGGDRFDEAIAACLQRNHNLVIDSRSAEETKIAIGSAMKMEKPLLARVDGRDLASGLARSVEVSSNQVVQAIQEPLRLIADGIREVLDETPRELAADILDRGMVLSGGGAQLRALDRYLEMHTGIPTRLAGEPRTSVVRGAGMALESFEVLRRNQAILR